MNYPEILGRYVEELPPIARTADWFNSLSTEHQYHLKRFIQTKSPQVAIDQIKLISQIVKPTKKPYQDFPIELRTRKPFTNESPIPRSPIPALYLLDNKSKYRLLLLNNIVETGIKFNPDFCYVAIEYVDQIPKRLCFGFNFRSAACKVWHLHRTDGLRVEDVLIHELKLGSID